MSKNTSELKFDLFQSAEWMLRYVYRSIKKQKDYILCSPPFSQTQYVYQVKDNSKFQIQVRDKIDLKIVQDIFSREDYGLWRLKRYDELVNKYQSIVHSGKVPLIIDLGANCGLAALYFALQYPASRIIGLEPDVSNYQKAKENCKHHSNVSFINAGISSKDGKGSIVNSQDENWSFMTEMSDDGNVQMISMKTLLTNPEIKDTVPFIVKIDIEGFEKDLFSANTEWVNQFELLVMEMHDWMLPKTANSNNFLRCISQYNRDFLYIGENVFSIKND